MTPFQLVSRASDALFGARILESARGLSAELGLPHHFVSLLLLVEDKRFAFHSGIDRLAVFRSAARNLAIRGIGEGASTISQQLYDVFNARMPGAVRDRSWSRKRSQSLFALQLETRWGKKEILHRYLERVYWGRAYYGLRDAADGYFRITPTRLSICQSFFLVERLASPNWADPWRVSELTSRPPIAAILSREPCWNILLSRIYGEQLGNGINL